MARWRENIEHNNNIKEIAFYKQDFLKHGFSLQPPF